jgi:uncharacterized protein with HEPN domain
MGKAAKKKPTKVRNRYPAVEWRKIDGPCDILAHTYFMRMKYTEALKYMQV